MAWLRLLPAAAGAAALLIAPAARADDAATSWTTGFTLAAVSDYKPRGISQSHNRPSLQGGFDAGHASGFYVGLWFYTIDIIRQTCSATGVSCSRSIELDLVGGWRGELAPRWTVDAGLIRYQYPGNDLARAPGFVNANTTEAYVGSGYGPVSLKFSQSLTTFGGFPDSERSTYLELNAAQEVAPGWTVSAHLGHQRIRQQSAFDATDYRLGLAKAFTGGFSASLTFNGSDADEAAWTANGRFWGRNTLVLGLQQVF